MSILLLMKNKIILVNMIVLVVSLMLTRSALSVFSVYCIFLLNELCFLCFGFDLLYDCYSRTELAYSLGSISYVLPSDMRKVHPNMTEGNFPTKTFLPPDVSEKNRFDHFIELLQIKSSDRVLDCGCGHGGLVAYLREKGIAAEGITICNTQYENNMKRIGPFFHLGNYTEPQHQLRNKFDFIILPGSLEHTFGGNVRKDAAYKKKHEQLVKMFSMMKDYFRTDSQHKKMLTTALHINDRFQKNWEPFVLERTFGGLYPKVKQFPLKDSMTQGGYEILKNEDYTWHYYFAAVCDIDHFGNPLDIGVFFTLIVSLLYPPIFYAYVYNKLGLWAWQFDGKHHRRRKTLEDHDLTFEPEVDKRPTTLFYTIGRSTICLNQ